MTTIFQKNGQEATGRPVKRANYAPDVRLLTTEHILSDKFSGSFNQALDKINALPPDKVHALLISQESGWDHWARNKDGTVKKYDPAQDRDRLIEAARKYYPRHVGSVARVLDSLKPGDPLPKISFAGAIGLTQTIPTTAEGTIADYRLGYTLRDIIIDSKKNYKVGLLTFKDMLDQIEDTYPGYKGNKVLAMATYNMGFGGLMDEMKRHGKSPKSPDFDLRTFLKGISREETRAYVPFIVSVNQMMDKSQLRDGNTIYEYPRGIDGLKSQANFASGVEVTAYLDTPRQSVRGRRYRPEDTDYASSYVGRIESYTGTYNPAKDLPPGQKLTDLDDYNPARDAGKGYDQLGQNPYSKIDRSQPTGYEGLLKREPK